MKQFFLKEKRENVNDCDLKIEQMAKHPPKKDTATWIVERMKCTITVNSPI